VALLELNEGMNVSVKSCKLNGCGGSGKGQQVRGDSIHHCQCIVNERNQQKATEKYRADCMMRTHTLMIINNEFPTFWFFYMGLEDWRIGGTW